MTLDSIYCYIKDNIILTVKLYRHCNPVIEIKVGAFHIRIIVFSGRMKAHISADKHNCNVGLQKVG